MGEYTCEQDKIKKRFLSKISIKNNNGCIEWKAALNNYGYGWFWVKNKNHVAHRISYELFVGKIPKNICVLHKCDNRKCINIKHLFLGTKKDNALDKIRKKRQQDVKGEKHPNHKLKEKDVIKIKKLLNKKSMVDIALKFNVSPSTIQAIKEKRNWSHISI